MRRQKGWVASSAVEALIVVLVLGASVWLVPRGFDRPAERSRTAGAAAAPRPTPSTSPATSTTLGRTAATSPPARQRSAVQGTVGIDGFALGLAFGAGSLWVATGTKLLRIDPESDRIMASIPIAQDDSGPAGVTFGAGAVWVPVAVPGSVWRVDPATNKVVARIALGESLAGFIGVSATEDAVWVTSGEQQDGERGGILIRVDPRRNRVAARVPLPGVPSDVAADRQSVWVATTSGLVLVVEPARGRVAGSVPTGGPLGFTQTIALTRDAAWLADPLARLVLRVDRKSLRVTAEILTGPVTALTIGNGAVWAVGPPGILRIDTAENRVVATLPASELHGVLMVTTGAGWLWAGGTDSISRVDPKLVTP